MEILVVTSCALDRERLQNLGPCWTDAALSFHFRDGLAEVAAQAVPLPDLVLFAPLLDASLLAARFPHAALAVLCNAGTPAARRRSVQGRPVAEIVLAQAGGRILCETFAALVAAARAHMAAARVWNCGDTVLESIADGIVTTDALGAIAYANAAARRLMRWTDGDMAGAPVAGAMVLLDAVTRLPLEHPVLQSLSTGHVVRLPSGSICVRADGSELGIEDSTAPIRSPDGGIVGTVMVFHDVTDARALQSQVDYLAWHDFLTGLPNRFAAERHLRHVLGQAQERSLPLAVMYLDLDKFKAVNDTLGHGAGDTLLASVAMRLRGCFRTGDLVSRQGGDEFVVLMAPGAGREDAIHAADRIIAAVSAPHQIESGKVHVGCSVGVAMFPEHGHDGATLLRHADTALHGAKAAGRNRWRFFTDDLLASAIERQQLEDGLRCGLDEAAFELFYQPKIRMADGLLCGCEALLRWHHPEWGWVSPLRFIHSAEETGLIVPLGRWALREAIRQARQWELAGLPGGTVAVNISALELRQEGFVASVHGLLAEVALTPARLQLELTESTLMRDMDAAAGLLGQLKALGLSIAIDDFGTGYSSLNYLAELPIDLLKVDRSFVHGIDRAAPRKQALLRAVLALGDSLAMPTVAEGVETQDEARFLLDAGCTLGQGYFYSRPMTPEAFGVAFMPGGGR